MVAYVEEVPKLGEGCSDPRGARVQSAETARGVLRSRGGASSKAETARGVLRSRGGVGELLPHRTSKGGVEPVYINME